MVTRLRIFLPVVLVLLVLTSLTQRHLIENNSSFPEDFLPQGNDSPLLDDLPNSHLSVSSFGLDYVTIDGNKNFSAEVALRGWFGSGTISDPFIISDLNISGTFGIRNTNLYFIINDISVWWGCSAIYLSNVTNGIISNNVFNTNNCYDGGIGVFMDDSDDIRFINNTNIGNPIGFYIRSSQDVDIINNSGGEIRVVSSKDFNITANNASMLSLSYSSNNIIANNEFVNGLEIFGKTTQDYIQAEVSGNTVNGQQIIYWQNVQSATVPVDAGQVFLVNSIDIDVTNLHLLTFTSIYSSDLLIRDNYIEKRLTLLYSNTSYLINNSVYHDIVLSYSEDNFLISNNVTSRWGISLDYSNNNTLDNNTITNAFRGIGLDISFYNIIKFNVVRENDGVGIKLSGSWNNQLFNNSIINNNGYGIYLENSRYNQLYNNDLVNDVLFIMGGYIEEYTQTLVANNIINGKPLLFWIDKTGGTIPSDLGQIFLINSHSITISNQEVSTIVGAFSSELTITNNTISEEIILAYSHNNFLSGNNLTGGGISLFSSDNNIVSYNYIENRSTYRMYSYSYFGIELRGSNGNLIMDNLILNNDNDGINLEESNSNTLSGNLIVENYDTGILVGFSSEANLVFNNTLSDNRWRGIAIENAGGTIVTNNSVSNSIYGIYNEYASRSVISSNFIFNNSLQALHIHYSSNVEVSGNIVSNTYDGYAIMLLESDHVHLSKNHIINNIDFAIFLRSDTEFITIIQNNFISNNPNSFEVAQAYDDGSNNIFIYNYWDDWTIADLDADGIVDVPYPLEGSVFNSDLYPYTTPNFQNHRLGGLNIIYPNGGENLERNAVIYWTPALDTLDHSVEYSIFVSPEGGNSWILLVSKLTFTSYLWDISTFNSSTSYIIKVVATCSEGLEVDDISDNSFSIFNLLTTTISTHPRPVSASTEFFATFILFSILVLWKKYDYRKRD
ncbi:MAG: NosD domain-containing protein [Candidatus Hodarchaeales archaeon]|jgi:parallel beta-helix repeat protein